MEKLKLNLIVRAKNKLFWMAFIPAVLLAVQAIAALFGFQLDLQGLQAQLLAVVDAVFGVLIVVGVVVDPTTKGFGDTKQAMTYTEPRNDNASA